jgi:hypothetical protein
MAKAKKFKSNTGSPVAIFVPDRPDPIQVPYYAPHLETDDKAVIDALQGSPEVVEVKEKGKSDG